MGFFDIDNKITITQLKEMGFKMMYWGSPDWYEPCKSHRTGQKPHWKPCRKYYSYFDEDLNVELIYFPKGFDSTINWRYLEIDPVDFKTNYIMICDNTEWDRFDSEIFKVNLMGDIDIALAKAKQLVEEYYNSFDYE